MLVVEGIEFEAQKSRHVLHHKGRRRFALLDFDVMSFSAQADGQTDDTQVHSYFSLTPSKKQLGVCACRIGRVKANISIQSTTNGLAKLKSTTNPPKSKSGGLVTNFGGFNLVS